MSSEQPTMDSDTMGANVIRLVTCPCCGDASPIDEAIRALVHVLNAHGMRTRSSCCGHRGRSREAEAYVLFWAKLDAVPAFCSALRRMEMDRLDLSLQVGWNTWDPPPDDAGLLALRLSITDTHGRAPKRTDLADLAAALDRALRGGCESAVERMAA
jgi:hypothetical protein